MIQTAIPKVRILIVEDETLVAQDISNRLTALNYEIVGIAQRVDQALHFLVEFQNIDLILTDIVLKGEQDGIDLAKIVNTTYKIPMIFLTSHSEEKVVERIKDVKPDAFLLKPFNDRQVSVAIEIALANFFQKTVLDTEEKKLNIQSVDTAALHIRDSLFLKKNHCFERVPLMDILFLEADNNYCTVYTTSNRYVYSTVLKKIEAQLPTNQFLRIHRSYVINIKQVHGFEGNTLHIGDKKIPVSKTYRKIVFDLFDTI